MKKAVLILIYGLTVWLSRGFCASYWVVGPVFAAAVLAFNFQSIHSHRISVRHLLLIASSTLIYALVYWIASKGWKLRPEWLDMLAGGMTSAVVIGSILMPSVHAMLFDLDVAAVRRTVLYLIVSWYAAILLSWIDDRLGLRIPVDYLLIAIALWQAIYLRMLKIP